jgi:phosphoribosylformylglycinamidine synthase
VHFKDEGDKVFVLGVTDPADLGASEYLSVHAGLQKGKLPTLDYDIEIRNGEAVRSLIDQELLASCHDLSQGGLASAVAEACFGPSALRGVRLWAEAATSAQEMAPHAALFSETGGRYLVSVKPKNEKKFLEFIQSKGIPVSFSGIVGGEEIIVEGCARLKVEEAFQRWSQGLAQLLGD